MMRTARFLSALALLALAGCFKLSRTSPPVQQYVLSGARAAAAAPVTADSGGLVIGIRRIDLASYLAQSAIVVRRGTHEIVTSRFHRWGEDLGEGINRTVAAQLANVAPVTAVDVAPWAARSQHDYLLQLHVLRFEGVVDSAAVDGVGAVHVRVAWDVIRPADGVVVGRGSTDWRGGRFVVGDYGSLVGELNAALERVSGDVRGCLGQARADSLATLRC